MQLKRSSAIFLHITSLPSDYGIGDLGDAAYRFVDFLHQSGHSYWQILPLNPTEALFGHSPYSSYSAFAGNPLLISPDLLLKQGLLSIKNLSNTLVFDDDKVDFEKVSGFKYRLLDIVYKNFKKKESQYENAFLDFCVENKDWLDDYSLYLTLKKKYLIGWTEWPDETRDRDLEMMAVHRGAMAEEIKKEKFIQFLFFLQWKMLVDYCHQQDIGLFGDIPFYINHDSADCWAHPEYFKLDKNKKPTKISGVPPDYFSETGQLWGTPVYSWKKLEINNFDWWIERLRQNLKLFDIVRLDHFRAFSAYWEVPAADETAENGKWMKVPGVAFFNLVKKTFPDMPFIAEDLGELDEPVFELLKKFNFPGMKVLQFAFGEEIGDNPYILHHHSKNNLVFTGTHDNNTTVGWFKAMDKKDVERFSNYVGIKPTKNNIHTIMHRLALMSVADLAIVPIQDLLGLDEKAIMNRPGTIKGNWTWRLKSNQLPIKKAKELHEMNLRYGRWKEKKVVLEVKNDKQTL